MTAQPNAHVRFRRAIERVRRWMLEEPEVVAGCVVETVGRDGGGVMVRRRCFQPSEAQVRSSEAQIRTVHSEMLKLAIEHPELADVFPSHGRTQLEHRRDMLANLILAHAQVRYRLGMLDEEGLREETCAPVLEQPHA